MKEAERIGSLLRANREHLSNLRLRQQRIDDLEHQLQAMRGKANALDEVEECLNGILEDKHILLGETLKSALKYAITRINPYA